LVEDFAQNPQKPIRLGVVGGGAGGVELTLSMQQRLHQILKEKGLSQDGNPEIHLFHRGAELVPGHSPWVRRRLHNILIDQGIQVHLEESVCEVLPNEIRCESGLTLECNNIFWVTQASAPNWLAEAGLKTDLEGFVLVKDTLQCLYHPHIFAAGDIATMVNHPRPKAGVFAVRQGKPLFENLRRVLVGKPPIDYKPQKFYLGLIGTGDKNAKEAIASWGLFGWQSPWLWRWKDHIDRKFMKRLGDLPQMQPAKDVGTTHTSPLQQIKPIMHCAGCGSKVGSTTLERVLQRLQIEYPLPERNDILVGLGHPMMRLWCKCQRVN
jgi:selenide,water dikinase